MKNYLIILFIISIATLIYLSANDFVLIGSDDSNIYFTYVKNFIESGEITYNADGERVEGYTSTLWFLIISVIYFFTTNIEIILLFLNIFLISFTSYYSILIINELKKKKYFFNIYSIFFLLFIVFYPGFIEWNIISLLETGLWTCLISIIFLNLLVDKNEKYNLFLIPLLVIARPESTLWILVILLVTGFRSYKKNNQLLTAIKHISPYLAVFLLTLSALIIFRYEYFGYLQANTYYAKVSKDLIHNFTQGIKYNIRFLISNLFQIILFIFLIKDLISIIKEKMKNIETYKLILIIIILTAYFIPLVTSGDHFDLFRFFQPYMILFFIYFISITEIKTFLEKFKPFIIKKKILVFSTIPIVYSLLNIGNFYLLNASFQKGTSPIFQEMDITRDQRNIGEALNKIFTQQKPSIGVITAGGIAYKYEGEIIDLLGLNNSKMAHADKYKYGIRGHASFHKATFYQLKPDLLFGWFEQDTTDIVAINKTENFREHFFNKVLKGLYFDTEFENNYKAILIIDKKNNLFYNAFININSIVILDKNGLEYNFL